MNRIFLLLFLFVSTTVGLFSSGVIESQDGLAYLSVARNIYYLGKPIAPPYEFDAGKNIHMNVTKAKDGNYYSPTGIGYSLALVPSVAISDLLHRYYQVAPPIHFPLESDWSLLLFASFVNPMFAGLLAVYICAYCKRLGNSTKMAVLISLLTIFTTNLFPLGKHGFPHTMFITTMMGVFYFLRRFHDQGKRTNIALAAINFGLMVVAYGPVYFLTFPALLTYYFLLSRPQLKIGWVIERVKDGVIGAVSLLPFLLLYVSTNLQKSGSSIDSGYGTPDPAVFRLNWHILYEGTFGLLLSPGRGFLWYSPLALLPLFFWHKLDFKKYYAEICALLLLAVFFIYFHATQNSGMNWLSWNGESSWGPRYISILLPFLGILTGSIVPKLGYISKILVIIPIICLGLGVQLLGVLMPYQIKFRGLQPETRLNDTRLTTADYANFIPRYSPLLNMPRMLLERMRNLGPQFTHGAYNVRFFDGVDFPFSIGNAEWRGLRSQAFIAVSGSSKRPLTSVRIGIANVPLASATASATVKLFANGQLLDTRIIRSGDWDNLEAKLANLQQDTTLILTTNIEIEKPKVQAIFIRDMDINGQTIPLRSLDFPYVQPLAAKMTSSTYRYFGNVETDPWQYWYLRSQIYEETFDLWWLKALYYWDLPHPLFGILFFVIAETTLVSGILLLKSATQFENGRLY